jgi:hypothetical protein
MMDNSTTHSTLLLLKHNIPMKTILFIACVLTACGEGIKNKQVEKESLTTRKVDSIKEEQKQHYPLIFVNSTLTDSLFLDKDSMCFYHTKPRKTNFPEFITGPGDFTYRYFFKHDTLVILTSISRTVRHNKIIKEDASYFSYKLLGDKLFFLRKASTGDCLKGNDTLTRLADSFVVHKK